MNVEWEDRYCIDNVRIDVEHHQLSAHANSVSSVSGQPGQRLTIMPLHTAEPDHDYTNLRGQVLPFIRLRALFSIKAAKPVKGENIVVLKYAVQKAGLVVDTLLGGFQRVIKPLGQMFNQVTCISGSTNMGSGDVALILDVPHHVTRSINAKPRSANNLNRQ